MAKVNNHDVVGLYNRLNRFLVELFKCASSSVSEVNTFDQTRLETYLTAVDTYHAWVVAQPHLDLPETSPKEYELEAPPTVADVENENINDIIRLVILCRDELINSQSARQPGNLNVFDSTRLTTYVAKVRNFLNDYIRAVTPLDLPESSPKEAQSGPGLLGT